MRHDTASTTKEVRARLKQELGLANEFAVPRIEKVVINTGIGRLVQSAARQDEFIKQLSEELARLTSQVPVVTRAKKSIASFKTRVGMPLGLKVTLRGKRMQDFLVRLIHVALPRSRDFKGLLPEAIDREGNFTLGLREHTIFPEVADAPRSIGLEITIVTTARDRKIALSLLRAYGFPFKQQE